MKRTWTMPTGPGAETSATGANLAKCTCSCCRTGPPISAEPPRSEFSCTTSRDALPAAAAAAPASATAQRLAGGAVAAAPTVSVSAGRPTAGAAESASAGHGGALVRAARGPCRPPGGSSAGAEAASRGWDAGPPSASGGFLIKSSSKPLGTLFRSMTCCCLLLANSPSCSWRARCRSASTARSRRGEALGKKSRRVVVPAPRSAAQARRSLVRHTMVSLVCQSSMARSTRLTARERLDTS